MKYNIGTSGWNYRHWKKRFYPEEQTDWLSYYSKQFDTVEVNSSFYSWPKKETLKNWAAKAPSDFKFTLKAPRMITHLKKLKDVSGYVQDLYKLGGLLRHKMGAFLFQLSPSYKNNENNLRKLKIFLDDLDGRKENVIEFREKSWWADEIYALLDENHVGFCSVFGLGMPKDVKVTGNIAYLRFHGKNYSTRYTKPSIEKFVGKIKKLKCRKVYAYFNNDARGYAPRNALELKEALKVE